MAWLQAFFSTPARQALGWTVIGILGIGMAAGGVWFLTDDGGGTKTADADDRTPTTAASPSATATRANTATPSPTASATPSPEATATTAPTIRPATNTSTGGTTGGNNSQAPAVEPTPEPTAPPVVAGGAYCPPSSTGPASGSLPSGRVAGAVTVGGANPPESTVDLSIAFDGVLGGSTKNVADVINGVEVSAFRIDFYASTSNCANRVGAAISVFANGQYFPTGRSVGDGGGQLIPVTISLP